MSSSKEVFALRKAGSLDEAYAMALEVIQAEPNDEWNIKAFAWCLYDLTKRSVFQNDYTTAKIYAEKLEALQISEFDEILLKSVEHAKVLERVDIHERGIGTEVREEYKKKRCDVMRSAKRTGRK